MRKWAGALLGILMPMGLVAQAGDWWSDFKPGEIARLPGYCQARMARNLNSPEYQIWLSRLGPDLLHTHHYCAGLIYLGRYYAKPPSRTSGDLTRARENFRYMVENAAPTYSLMPDVYLNLGEVERFSGNTALAASHYEKAISLDPRARRAYGLLADMQRDQGDGVKALETVTEGLRRNPDAKTLQRRYRELGGKLPYPASAEPRVEAIAPAPQPSAPLQPSQAGNPPPAAPATPVAPAAAPVEPAKPGIGSPTNPYCRFCVD